MPTLYLLDSILKNHPDNYKQHIEEILASVFEVTFSSGDEKIRMAMYKLRQTWTPWFQYKTLYDLDMRTKKLDKAWPVIENPSKSGSGSDLPTASKPKDIKRQTSNIHVNPNFVARAPSVSEDSQNEDDELKAMEEKIKEMQEKQKRKKAQIEKDRKRKELEALLEKERIELERVERVLKETELPKISTSGSKSKDSHTIHHQHRRVVHLQKLQLLRCASWSKLVDLVLPTSSKKSSQNPKKQPTVISKN